MTHRICFLLLPLLLIACAGQPPSVPVREVNVQPEPEAEVVGEGSFARGEHLVVAGDTLYSIALRHDMDFRTLARINGIEEPYTIYPRQRLRLSEGGGVRAEPSNSRELARREAARADARRPGARTTDSPRPEPLRADSLAAEPHPEPLAPGPLDPAPLRPGPPDAEPVRAEPPQAVGRASELADPARGEADARVAGKMPATTAAPPVYELAGSTPAGTGGPAGAEPIEAAEQTPEPVAATPEPLASAPRRAGAVTWNWPLNGKVLKGFALKGDVNKGIDISARPGSQVRAAAEGSIVYAGGGLRGYGKLVIIKHNDEFLSAYGNNAEILVKEGQRVESGKVIAMLGEGNPAMVHFEIRREGKPVPPLDYLPSR